MAIKLTADYRGLVIVTSYKQRFVELLKQYVPVGERSFTGKSGNPANAWVVAPKHAGVVKQIVEKVFGCEVELPDMAQAMSQLVSHVQRLEYIGQCKNRPDGSVTAMGHDGAGWNVVIAESVLKSFFEGDWDDDRLDEAFGNGKAPQRAASLYAALLLKPSASSTEIKTAYRRMSRQWHPDVCREDGATEKFIEIKKAYDLLSDPLKRRRYDAGLAMEATTEKVKKNRSNFFYASIYGYRSPLRCGLLTIDGECVAGRVIVSKIHAWDDIVNAVGQTMVSSWKVGDESYTIAWV